jgi:hypothetical protein
VVTGVGERADYRFPTPRCVHAAMNKNVSTHDMDLLADDSWAVRHEYRLTDKGADLYHVPLAILTWGQRWLGAAESDTTLTHTPCGADLEVVFSCGVCAEPMTRNTIVLDDDH